MPGPGEYRPDLTEGIDGVDPPIDAAEVIGAGSTGDLDGVVRRGVRRPRRTRRRGRTRPAAEASVIIKVILGAVVR